MATKPSLVKGGRDNVSDDLYQYSQKLQIMHSRESGESSGRKNRKSPIAKPPSTLHYDHAVAANAQCSEQDGLVDESDFKNRKRLYTSPSHKLVRDLKLVVLQILILK